MSSKGTEARSNMRIFVVEVSTVVAAVFGILTYVDQQRNEPVMTGIQDSTARIAAIATAALEQNLAQLKLLARMLPEAEQTRIGMAKLIDTAEKQLAELRAQNGVGKRNGLPSSAAPRGDRSNPQLDVIADLNARAAAVWKDMSGREK